MNWVEHFQSVSELQKRATGYFVKLCTSLLIAYLLIVALNEEGKVGVTIQGVSAAIPTAHFALTASLIFLFSTLSFVHLLVIFSLRAKISARISLHGFSSNMFGLLNGYDDMALSIPISQNTFLKEFLPVSRILSFFLFLAVLGLLIPFFAFGYYLSAVQFDLLRSQETPFFEKMAATSGIGLVIYSIIYFFIFHIPLPMVKSKYNLRWGFLAKTSNTFPHPRANFWLDDNK